MRNCLKKNTATDIEDIVELLQKFNELMNQRKAKIKEKLNTKLEGTYADFQLEQQHLRTSSRIGFIL